MNTGTAYRLSHRLCTRCTRRQQRIVIREYSVSQRLRSEESRLPRVANPAFWSSMVPRFLKRTPDVDETAENTKAKATGSQEKRAALVLLALGIVVGSNAINLIALKREMLNFSRQTDARLELLREVVQKVKNGEDIDVRKALGTGDENAEKEWKQVMEELESTDMLLEGRKKREAKRQERIQKQGLKNEEKQHAAASESDATSTDKAAARPKFLM